MRKKAFTLMELLIVMVIMAVFSWVLFKTFNTISEISFRVEQQKKVNEELLFVSEILQNYANRNSIDFEQYGENLNDTYWFTNILYLSGEDWRFHIFSSGECVDFSEVPDPLELRSGCALYVQSDEEGSPLVKLTDDSAYFTRAKFKIIPYSDKYFSDDFSQCKTNYFACVNDVWFWLFTDVYPKLYSDTKWANNVHLLVQQFFNI